MEWEIVPFVGAGPLRFGMSTGEVAALIGPPSRTRTGASSVRELRSQGLPIVYYRDGQVSEIEFYREVENVKFETVTFFVDSGIDCLRYLETQNGGAAFDVGTILFDKLGITTGRLDQNVVEEHTVTAFNKGVWDEAKNSFQRISFI